MKEQLLEAAKEMLDCGLVQGTAGNLAARLPDGNVVLTPSSLDYRTMTLDDLVVCDLDGNVVEGTREPDVGEDAAPLARCARHPEINATMHCHAKYCTMFALTRKPIPAVIEEVRRVRRRRRAGRRVQDHRHRRARRRGVAGIVGDRAAVLMANHGLFAVGQDPAARRSHSRSSWSAPPRSCGARSCSARSCPLPDAINEQFSGYYRMGRGRS